MKRILFSAIALISGFLISLAQSDSGYSLVVEQPSGTTMFLLSTHPVISYSGEDMIITAPDGDFSCPRSEVSRIYFTTEVNSSAVVKPDMKVSLRGDVLCLSGIENANDVKVYDLMGHRIAVETTVESEGIFINFSQTPKNTYIISIPNRQSLKISLK